MQHHNKGAARQQGCNLAIVNTPSAKYVLVYCQRCQTSKPLAQGIAANTYNYPSMAEWVGQDDCKHAATGVAPSHQTLQSPFRPEDMLTFAW
jgi:hypothetical protein